MEAVMGEMDKQPSQVDVAFFAAGQKPGIVFEPGEFP